MTVVIIRQTTPEITARVTREYVLANSHRALVEQAVKAMVEQIGRASNLEVLHGRAHQGIAVAYQNLTARHRVPKPRGKDRRDRIHFGPDEARDSTLGPLPPVRPSPRRRKAI